MPFSVANQVGRLIEVRVDPPLNLEDATRFMLDVVRLTSAQPGKVLACTDLRSGTRATDPASIDLIAGIMSSENPRLERNALVVSNASPTFLLQMERLVKAAGGGARRIFRTRQEAETWLGQVATDAERQRLHAFLDEGTTG